MKDYLTKKNIFLFITTAILAAVFVFIALKLFRDTGTMIEQYQEIEAEK